MGCGATGPYSVTIIASPPQPTPVDAEGYKDEQKLADAKFKCNIIYDANFKITSFYSIWEERTCLLLQPVEDNT